MSKPAIDCVGTVEAGSWPGEDEAVANAQSILEVAAGYLHAHESQPFPSEPVEVSLLFTDDGPLMDSTEIAYWASDRSDTHWCVGCTAGEGPAPAQAFLAGGGIPGCRGSAPTVTLVPALLDIS